jgi:hypothetical protein
MEVSLDRDPRWLKLHDSEWTCPCCGENHRGLFDVGCDWPYCWQGPKERKPNSEVLTSNNVLTKDFCILNGEDFFVRCVLRLPIIGASEEYFAYGVWTSASKENFHIYLDTFDADNRGDFEPWLGWFSNRLPGYPDTLNLKCRMHPQSKRQRPISSLSRPIILSRSSSERALRSTGCWRSMR